MRFLSRNETLIILIDRADFVKLKVLSVFLFTRNLTHNILRKLFINY